MACSECNGVHESMCPNCGSSADVCPECYGEGTQYWARCISFEPEREVQVTPTCAFMLPRTREEAEAKGQKYYFPADDEESTCTCDKCGGIGVIW